MATAAFSASVAYFIGRQGAYLSLQGGLYGALVIVVFFAALYCLGAALVYGARAQMRSTKRQRSEAPAAALGRDSAVPTSEVMNIRASLDELLSAARADGARVSELHGAFKTAQAERQRR